MSFGVIKYNLYIKEWEEAASNNNNNCKYDQLILKSLNIFKEP